VKRGPGRPPGSGAKKRGPGRPKGSSKAAAAPAANAGAQTSATAAPAKRGRRRRSAITPEQLASRQLQGRYLGLIRQVPQSKRAQYQKIAKEKGREAAIRELQDAVKK
jgi:O6-methylguanine-DNA--protein-cysteine methyltransferase